MVGWNYASAEGDVTAAIAPYRVLCWSLKAFWLSISLAENQTRPMAESHNHVRERADMSPLPDRHTPSGREREMNINPPPGVVDTETTKDQLALKPTIWMRKSKE
jgi:hypothetical protein